MLEAEIGIQRIREKGERRQTLIAIYDLLPRKLPGGPMEESFARQSWDHRFRSRREHR
jgi:hypothetical protein